MPITWVNFKECTVKRNSTRGSCEKIMRKLVTSETDLPCFQIYISEFRNITLKVLDITKGETPYPLNLCLKEEISNKVLKRTKESSEDIRRIG